MKYILTLAAALSIAIGIDAAPAPWPPTPTGTPFCKMARIGPPIVADSPSTAVHGLQLSVDTATPTLVKKGFTGGYDFISGGVGAWRGCHDYWLNIGTSPYSYKPLTWDFDSQLTTTWTADIGTLVHAGATADYLATATFLTCNQGGSWVVYLQTGSDVPSGVTCYITQLRVATA
ncbi:glycoside hydrolase family 47 protein [Tulasnella calospora MUT 4182]|uniref:Glycoside hydrolase family 47 protein n=1 Tax=Tulasnella calospora MUT 4182 TaxID=1051891 RepID=A0A0C3QC71_9AGAM|nr:glycoside hydrolase family 47 protein [Tulasnella calospora MUT 4182]